jgi:hypothetical protein
MQALQVIKGGDLHPLDHPFGRYRTPAPPDTLEEPLQEGARGQNADDEEAAA